MANGGGVLVGGSEPDYLIISSGVVKWCDNQRLTRKRRHFGAARSLSVVAKSRNNVEARGNNIEEHASRIIANQATSIQNRR